MKLSIVFFAAAILYVSASPLAETPSVRGPSQGCKDKWTQTVAGLSLVTTVAKGKLIQVAAMQMLQMSYWFTSTTAKLQLNIDAGAVLGTAVSTQMTFTYPATQVTYIQTYFQTAINSMKVSVDAVKGASASQGKAMQAQLTKIQANITAVITQLQTVSATASIFSSLILIVSDATITQLTATVQAVAQLQNDCGCAYSDANSASQMPSLLMDVVIATTTLAKQQAATAVCTAVSTTVTVTQTAVQAVVVAQATAMQATSSVAEVSMTTVSTASAVVLSVLVTSMMIQTQFDVNCLVTGVAELEDGNTNCTEEIVANITETNAEFSEMCSNTTDADNITATAENVTAQITLILQTQSTLTVQMCASVAISGILVEQTKGHNGIGQCVSDGKKENDADMQEIQQNFTGSALENQQNLTNCANKYADPNYSGNAPSNTDSGANKSEKMDSCKKVSLRTNQLL